MKRYHISTELNFSLLNADAEEVKNRHVNIITTFKHIVAVAIVLMSARTSFSQSTENQQMVFDGSLTDTSGNPIDLTGAPLTFYISINGCYLYGESSSAAGDSQGNILHRIGSGSPIVGSPNSFSQNIFFGTVSGTTAFAGNNCTATAADTRLAQVYYPAQNISATIKLGTVPYAQNATMFAGKNATDFAAWVNSALTSSHVTSALGYTPANNSTLGSLATKNLVNLASAEVTGILPAANLPNFTGDVATVSGSTTTILQNLRGKPLLATTPTSGQVLLYDGSSWGPSTISYGNGTVTNINTGSGLSGGPITSTGTLSVNFGTISGTVAAGNDSRIIGALQSTSNLSDLSSTASARTNLGLGSLAQKTLVDLATDVTGVLAVANGGTQWTTTTNGTYFVSNTAIGSSSVPVSSKLYVEAFSGNSTASFKNTATNGYGVKIEVAGVSSTQYALNVVTGLGSAFMVQNDSKVGVGTMTPTARLHLGPGNLSLSPLRFTSANLPSSATAGAVEYDGAKFYVTDDSGIRRSVAAIGVSNNLDGVTSINSPIGKVGIGTNSPTTALTVSGSVRSTAGGFEFPDGSVQTSAVGGWERNSQNCSSSTCTATCSPGKRIISGGCSSASTTLALVSSYPVDATNWLCAWSNTANVTAYAVCMNYPN